MIRIFPTLALCVLIGQTFVFGLPWIAEPKADEEWWMERHEEYLNNSFINWNGTNVVFFGDSITQNWAGEGIETFNKYYAPIGTANYGIGSDRIEHVLWRIVNGEIDALRATHLCVLKIGTNNLWMNTDEETARGIAAIVDAIISRKPSMKILLLGILPRSDEEMTKRVENVNQMISILDNENSIRYLNLGNSFYYGNGTFATELYNGDLLHLSPEGYAKWAETMDPLFQEMLNVTKTLQSRN